MVRACGVKLKDRNTTVVAPHLGAVLEWQSSRAYGPRITGFAIKTFHDLMGPNVQ